MFLAQMVGKMLMADGFRRPMMEERDRNMLAGDSTVAGVRLLDGC